jgi:hypothetical protein
MIYHGVEVGVNEAMFVQLTVVESPDAFVNECIDNESNNKNVDRVTNVSFLVFVGKDKYATESD